ncbi:MAG: response regulator transcription factor [bacterium]
MRILIVEDDADFAHLMAKYLEAIGECEFAVNGMDAVESVRLAFEEEKPFDLICLDIMMPTMDGQEALIKIRGLEQAEGLRVGEGAKIIMVTALSDDQNKIKSFVGLCDAYITKPFDKDDLFAKLRDIELIYT